MTGTVPERRFITTRDLLLTTSISGAYMLLCYVLIGYTNDQLSLVLLFNVCYYLSRITRKFITGFAIFIVFWIIFDMMKAFPNYWYGDVSIEQLYNAEKRLFGIKVNETIVTPNEYWAEKHNSFLDVLTGAFYLSWVPVPLGFATFLFFKKRRWFLQFSLCFLFVNLIGFAIYYIYPAAPPWYVALHGFEFIPNTPGNTAGLERFDAYFNVSIFKSLYAKSSNVFAAMPSLHSAYPLLVFYHGLRYKLGTVNIVFAILMVGIWFSAVYSSHHYVLDVTAGVLCAVAGTWLFNKLSTTKPGSRFLDRYEKAIH